MFHSILVSILRSCKRSLLGREATLCLCILWGINLQAQHSDGGVWTKIATEKKFKGPWEIGLAGQARTAQYSTVLSDLLVDVEAGYKISDLLSASFTYRQAWKREPAGYMLPSQRISLDFQAKHDIGNVGVSLRSRYQVGVKFAQTEAPDALGDAIRYRLKADMKLMKKTEANASIEFFTSADYGIYTLTDIRYQVEVTRKLKKRKYLSVGYQFQKERQTADPLNEHVLLLSLNLELK